MRKKERDRKFEKFEIVTCRAENRHHKTRITGRKPPLSKTLPLSLSLKVTRDHTTKEEDIFHIEIQGKESEAKKETQLAQYQHHHVAVHFFTSLLLFIYVIVSVFIFFSEKMQSIFVFVFVINRSSSTSSSSLQNASNVIICRAGLESETERTRRVDWQRGNRSENQSG